jgi:hypothetical protein
MQSAGQIHRLGLMATELGSCNKGLDGNNAVRGIPNHIEIIASCPILQTADNTIGI